MSARRTSTALAVSGLLLLAGAGTAHADHTHVRVLGNGQCVVLAADGGEKYVQLPHADSFPENRRHPLHVNVHLGEPGTRHGEGVVFVRGSADDLAHCDGYVND
ncbi:hypothetical protein [Ornithinimicrobium cerasi]|uniref:Uncharacterized protein n=1 Tax=Ornithinimicrobium cerasi TaxID=2248773 RepID=A0A285VQI9_9MICO|nr:hypothetical protein [Ornithinimicrobium cerasi]SOC56329.1 hypothetical protein SAMN05421879_107109 [Ornithinimicrobium cerasi]